jgi:V/A-type H+-transporting ATPase subunit A
MIKKFYERELDEDIEGIRNRMLNLLFDESRLLEIVLLVGEDVLPDDQRLILEIARVLKIGFLQQNAFHKDDTYVPLKKQLEMLKTIELLYERGLKAIKMGIPISRVRDAELYEDVIKIKYTISNDEIEKLQGMNTRINDFYNQLESEYSA